MLMDSEDLLYFSTQRIRDERGFCRRDEAERSGSWDGLLWIHRAVYSICSIINYRKIFNQQPLPQEMTVDSCNLPSCYISKPLMSAVSCWIDDKLHISKEKQMLNSVPHHMKQ